MNCSKNGFMINKRFVSRCLNDNVFFPKQGMIYGYLTAGLGIGVGAHRYWTHRCFKATKPLQYLLMLMHASAFQEPLCEWCRVI